MLAAPALQCARGSGDRADADQHPARRRADPAARARQPADGRDRPGCGCCCRPDPTGPALDPAERRAGAHHAVEGGRVAGRPAVYATSPRAAGAQLPGGDRRQRDSHADRPICGRRADPAARSTPVLRLVDADADRPLERARTPSPAATAGWRCTAAAAAACASRWVPRHRTAACACETPTSPGWPEHAEAGTPVIITA